MKRTENQAVNSSALQTTQQISQHDNQSANLFYPTRALILKTSSNSSNYLDALNNMNNSTNCSLNSFNSVFLPSQDRHFQNNSSISQQKMLKDRFEQMVMMNSTYSPNRCVQLDERQQHNIPQATSEKEEESKEQLFPESASKKQGNVQPHEEQYLCASLNRNKRKQMKVIDQRLMEEKKDTLLQISSAVQGKKYLNQSQNQNNSSELQFYLKDQDNNNNNQLKASSSPYKDLLFDRSVLESIITTQYIHRDPPKQLNLPSVMIHQKNVPASENPPPPKQINNKTLRNARRRQLLALQRFRSVDENHNKNDNNPFVCLLPQQEQPQQQQQILMKKCVISFSKQNNSKLFDCSSSQESPKSPSEPEVSFRKRRPLQLSQQETLILQESMSSRNQSPLQANLMIKKLPNQKTQFKKNYFVSSSPSPAGFPPNQRDLSLQLSSQQLSSDFSSSQPSQISKINHTLNLHVLSKTSSISFNESTKTTTISPRIHNKQNEAKDIFRSSCSSASKAASSCTTGFSVSDNPPPFKFHMNNSCASNNSNNLRRLSAQSLRGSPRNTAINQNSSKKLKQRTPQELVLSSDCLEIDPKQACLIEGKSYHQSSRNGDRLENPFLNILKETLNVQASTVHNLKGKRTSPRNIPLECQAETLANSNNNNITSRAASRVTCRNTTAIVLRETAGALKQSLPKKSENTKNMFITGERFKERNSSCTSPNRTVQTARSPANLRRILLSVDKPKSKMFEEINQFKQSNEGFADHQFQQADQIWSNFSIEEYIHLSKGSNEWTNRDYA